ncbi:MAG: ABC transporter permease, partial [Thermoplasmata archaeon]
DGAFTGSPQYVPGSRNYLASVDRDVVYVFGENLHVNISYSIIGGMGTPVSLVGNIFHFSSQTGNYYATVTKDDVLYVQLLTGQNIAPLSPGQYPSGNTYVSGTDDAGHDIWTWIVYGTRAELIVGLLAAVFAVGLGVIVGLVSGYLGGKTDSALMRVADIFLSLPGLVIILLMAAVLGPSLFNVIFIIGILSWPAVSRVIRAQTLTLKERTYVDAARIAGASDASIVFKQIAPNVLPLAFLYMSFLVSGAIIVEALLAFLGLGDPTQVTWGMTLQFLQISGHTLTAWWWLLPPGLAITLLALAFYLIGRGFDEIVNPRLRKR